MFGFKRLSIPEWRNHAAPTVSVSREETLHNAWKKNQSLGGVHRAVFQTQNWGTGECRALQCYLVPLKGSWVSLG